MTAFEDYTIHLIDLRRPTGIRIADDGRLITQTPVICALDIVEHDRAPFRDEVTYVPSKATCADCRARIEEGR